MFGTLFGDGKHLGPSGGGGGDGGGDGGDDGLSFPGLFDDNDDPSSISKS